MGDRQLTDAQEKALRALSAFGPMGGSRLGRAVKQDEDKATGYRRLSQGYGRIGILMADRLIKLGYATPYGGGGDRLEVRITDAGRAALEGR